MSKMEPLTSKSDSSTVIATSPVLAKNLMSESLSDLSVWKSSLPAKHITEKNTYLLNKFRYSLKKDIWLHEKDMEGEYMKAVFWRRSPEPRSRNYIASRLRLLSIYHKFDSLEEILI
jgi:hypothetical protein